MGRVEGKVAFITGAARGQGRAHAVRLAEEGADIIAMDLCAPIATSVAKPSTPEDLAETVRQVEKLDRRIFSYQADVRDYDALKAGLDAGLAELGRLDIVVGNAGMWSYRRDRGVQPGGLEGDHRHQPERRLEHDPGHRPGAEGGRPRRLDHPHQLGGRPQGLRLLRPVRGGQARRGRHHADGGDRARARSRSG